MAKVVAMQSAKTSCSVILGYYEAASIGAVCRGANEVHHACTSSAPAHAVGDIVNYGLPGSLAWPPESSTPAYTKALQKLG